MKILIIPTWYPSEMDPNGVPYVQAQAQALVRAGHQVTVVFSQAYSLKTVFKQKRLMFGIRENTVMGVKEIFSYFPKTHFRRIDELTRSIYGKKIINKEIKKFFPDIIHAHTYLAGPLAVWCSKKYKRPLVVTEHYTGFARNIVKPWEMKIARNLYKNSLKNIAVSNAFKQLLQDKTGESFAYIGNMVNTELFNFSSLTRETQKGYTFLFVGTLHPKKNTQMLLNAFVELSKIQSDCKLILAGEGELYSELLEIVRNNKLENRVFFKGYLKAEGIAQLMKEANCFVLPSKFETFGIVVIEAMATGLPVIVSKSGGPETFVINGEHGLVIEQDEHDLLKAMIDVQNIKWDRDVNREYVLENFSETQIIKKLENIYTEVINIKDKI